MERIINECIDFLYDLDFLIGMKLLPQFLVCSENGHEDKIELFLPLLIFLTYPNDVILGCLTGYSYLGYPPTDLLHHTQFKLLWFNLILNARVVTAHQKENPTI